MTVPHYRHPCTAQEMREHVGEKPFVVYVSPATVEPLQAILDTMPYSRLIVFVQNNKWRRFAEDCASSSGPRLTCIKAVLGQCVTVPTGTVGPQMGTLDWFHDHYAYPIDLIICLEPDRVPSLILGGVRTIARTRYLLLGHCDGLDEFLPAFEIEATYSDSVMLKNKTPIE